MKDTKELRKRWLADKTYHIKWLKENDTYAKWFKRQVEIAKMVIEYDEGVNKIIKEEGEKI